MVDSIARIALRLAARPPACPPDPAGFQKTAAVAAILRECRDGTEVLLIKRASRPGDIWSGHMAFPGGHRDALDADLAATAVRETHEEIGLDLGRHGRLLGAIDPLDVNPIGTRYRMLVAPYVFALEGELPALRGDRAVRAALRKVARPPTLASGTMSLRVVARNSARFRRAAGPSSALTPNSTLELVLASSSKFIPGWPSGR